MASVGTPLTLLDCAVVCNSEVVGERGRAGRGAPDDNDCLERLPEDVAERRLGEVPVPREAKLAKALEVFSRASEARERRLLL